MRKNSDLFSKNHVFLYVLAGLFALLLVMVVRMPKARPSYYQPNPFQAISLKNTKIAGFGNLKAQIKQYIDEQPGVISVYFWDLTTGSYFGINEDMPLPAASSIKIPVALYLYQQVADKKISLDETMAYDPDLDWSGGAGTIRWNAAPGQKYTLRELAQKLIRESDNVAWKMLYRRLGKSNIAVYMENLGVRQCSRMGRITPRRKIWRFILVRHSILRTDTQISDGISLTIWFAQFTKTACLIICRQI